MGLWGKRKDNKKSYIKIPPKGVSGAGTKTDATGDVHMKERYKDVDASRKLTDKELEKFTDSDVFKVFSDRYKVDEVNDVIILDGVPYSFEVNHSPPYVAIDNLKTNQTVYFTQDEGVSNLEKDAGSLDAEIVFYYLDSAGVFQDLK